MRKTKIQRSEIAHSGQQRSSESCSVDVAEHHAATHQKMRKTGFITLRTVVPGTPRGSCIPLSPSLFGFVFLPSSLFSDPVIIAAHK